MRQSEWKAANAAERSMTPQEQKNIQEAAKVEYRSMSAQAREDWKSRYESQSRRNKQRRRSAAQDATQRPSPREPATKFTPLWFQTPGERPELFSNATREFLGKLAMDTASAGAAEAVDWNKCKVWEAPPRCKAEGLGWGKIWGCQVKMKNVCRTHVLEDQALRRSMDSTLLAHINAWVNSLGRETVEAVNSFVWFRTHRRSESGRAAARA